MSATPDFEQIATRMADALYETCADGVTQPRTNGPSIIMTRQWYVEQLRQVWNARGATDAKAVLSHPLTPGTGINQAELARNAELVKAITEHDR